MVFFYVHRYIHILDIGHWSVEIVGLFWIV